MSETRRIRRVIQARPTLEGAGVHLKRAIGFGDPELTDPFLLLDDFRSDTPAHYLKGFPWHPHRGMETITYVLAGDVEHRDSMGNGGVISAGDVQWMTAGNGILHQEMPQGDAQGRMYGFQLWANLPASHKMMDPRYQGVTSLEIPEVTEPNGTKIKIICGEVNSIQGPVVGIVTDPEYLDVTVMPGTTFTRQTPRGHTVFAYVIEGRGAFGQPEPPTETERAPLVGNAHLVLYGDGDAIAVTAEQEAVRFLLVSAKPIREPVAWRGPIVMNTQQELRTAFEELERGTFIKSQG